MPWRTNIALLLAVEGLYIVLLGVTARMPVGVALTLFVVGCVGTLPTAALFLVLVAAIPPAWSGRQKRLVALACSPLIAGFFFPLAFMGAVWLLLILLIGTTTYGAIVRLPRERLVDARHAA